jgi:uncharacterized protein YecT (DUF1311 family)
MRAELKSGSVARSTRGVGATILVAISLGMSQVIAADREFSKDFEACLDKAGGVTPAMMDCISAELKRQDALLNQNYRKLMASLSAGRKKALQEAQRAWIKFRDGVTGRLQLRRPWSSWVASQSASEPLSLDLPDLPDFADFLAVGRDCDTGVATPVAAS